MTDEESLQTASKEQGNRFSNRETALILKTIREYVSDNDLELADVCRCLRESKEEDQKRTLNRHSVWKTLGELLPHRTVKVGILIYKWISVKITLLLSSTCCDLEHILACHSQISERYRQRTLVGIRQAESIRICCE